MIILKTGFIDNVDEFTDPLVFIEQAPDGYQITRRNAGAGEPLTLRASDLPPWGMKLYYWSFTGHGFMEGVGFEDNRDADSFMRSRFGCNEGPVLSVARGLGDELALILFKPTHTDLAWTRQQGFGSSIEAFDQALPGFSCSPQAVTNLAKRDLLRQVGPINMLAEQEKQIDLLSMLVVDLAQKQPLEQQPHWLAAFKAMLEQHNSVQFKGVASALADVEQRKARMRDLQRAYFAQRDGVL